MLFTPELRRTLESAFLPLACECTVMPGGALMVKIFEPQTGAVAMQVENVSITNLTTMRGVAELVAELRYDLRTCVTPFGSTLPFCGTSECMKLPSAESGARLRKLSTLSTEPLPSGDVILMPKSSEGISLPSFASKKALCI